MVKEADAKIHSDVPPLTFTTLSLSDRTAKKMDKSSHKSRNNRRDEVEQLILEVTPKLKKPKTRSLILNI